MVRVLHTSDTHLGLQQFTRTDAAGLNQKEADIAAAWHAVIDAAVAQQVDLFLHAGDLFDGVRPGNRALAHAMEGFLKLSRAGIPTVVIAGNHEHPKLRETGSPFRLFAHLPGIHVVYQGHAESIPLSTRAGPVTVHAVPQCSDNQELARQVAALRPDPTHAGPNLLMLHGAVSTLRAFSHAEFNEQSIDPAWLDDRFDYVALGHYHTTQQAAARAWYCGAPERVSIAEAGEAKGYLLATVQRAALPDVTFQPIAGRTYVDLPVLQAETFDAPRILEEARHALQRIPPGAVARLRIRDVQPHLRASLDVRALRQAASHLLHLHLDLAWLDEGSNVRGGPALRGLGEEFDAFAQRQPLQGVDRQKLLAACHTLLAQAGEPAGGAA